MAITGTDGKTTVTTMVTDMLEASGRKALAVGNTDVPFVAALDEAVDVFVVEASSFRLRFTERFAPEVARGSTSPPTTSTGTAPSTPTGRPRRASSSTSRPTPSRSATRTTRS